MPSLCDVNVLLALAYEGHPHHPPALRWLGTVGHEHSLAVCRITQLGLLRLLNNPTVLGANALSATRTWQIYDQLMADQRFFFADEPQKLDAVLRNYVAGRVFSPKLWQDAYLAAFARACRDHLVTFDSAFRQFTGLATTILSAAG